MRFSPEFGFSDIRNLSSNSVGNEDFISTRVVLYQLSLVEVVKAQIDIGAVEPQKAQE